MRHSKDHPQQIEFLIVESDTPAMGVQDLEDPLFREIGQHWSLPVGRSVRVRLRVPGGLSMLEGKLEVAKAPDYPFRGKQALSLRIKGIPFNSTQIEDWIRLDN
ncbi:MAG: hypothetical protein JW706_10955 [Opitutales bacterium]|nr:hypothetical protein [Opitutales bacterium]